MALADHFDLLLLIFSPLYYIFGTYTLLLVQAVFILIGGRGIYLNALDFYSDRKIAVLAQVVFCGSFGVLSAVAFDYHSNVIAACLVPYLFYYYRHENKKMFLCVFVLIFISKENMVLWLAFIVSALPFLFPLKKELKRTSFLLAGISLVTFYLISSVIMPALAGLDRYPNFKYTSAGGSESFKDVFIFLLSHPLESIQLLFTNTSGNDLYDHYKTEAHIFILISGGIFFFIRPLYLWILLPVYLQKFLHDSESMWGLAYQYNIEFIPIVLIMVLDVAHRLDRPKVQRTILLVFLFLNVALSVRLMDRTVSFIKHSGIRFYQKEHYVSDYNTDTVYSLMEKIPDTASVNAQTVFTPHLAGRDQISMFTGAEVKSDYVIIADADDTYPLNKKDFEAELNKMLQHKNYRLRYFLNGVYLFERIS